MRPLQGGVLDERGEYRREMLLVQDAQVVQALAPERADASLDHGVGPRARYGRGNGIDADSSGPLAEVAPRDRVMITEQMAWLVTPGRRLNQLLPHPGRGRVGGHVPVHQLAPTVSDEHE